MSPEPDIIFIWPKQWCKRESIDANVLHPWLLNILQRVEKQNKLFVFVSNLLTEPRNKLYLSTDILHSELHPFRKT